MKAVIILAILMANIVLDSFGQNPIAPNKSVREAYSDEAIALLPKERIEYLNFLSEFCWEIVDAPEGKISNIQSCPYLYKIDRDSKMSLSEYFKCSEIKDFNILLYDYNVKETPSYYRIGDCDKILIIKTQSDITKSFNEYRKK